MEILKMDYRFTALLIFMLTMLAFFGKPAHSRNEYLNNGYNSCNTGSFDISVEQRDRDTNYINNGSSTHENEEQNVKLTYRHWLGSACTDDFKKVQQENMELKQQLELMKMCGRVNSNPSLAYNSNFDLLTSKCRGVTPTSNRSRPENSGSLWDELKDEYKKENPDVKLMGDKFLKPTKKKLKVPKYLTDDQEIVLPIPTND